MRILIANDDGIDGPPADCVALGVNQWDDVDLVLSGINMGPNLGNATWHSGTPAAAKQAALLGIRGIALSAPGADETTDVSELEPWVVRALETILERGEPSLVNVNLPLRPRGMSWTRQAVDRYDGTVVPDEDPAGRRLSWFTVVPLDEPDEGTHHAALAVSAEAAAR